MMRWLLWGFLWVMATVSAEPVTRKPPLQVLVFWDTECPISQKTTGRIQAMAKQYGSRVRFEVIYPTPTVILADINAFERDYNLTLPHRLDPTHTLVKRYKVTTTPEVLLLSDRGKLLYRGSIDDQFYRLGRYRPAPTAFYLKDAIDATLAGKPIPINQTTPTGCLINR